MKNVLILTYWSYPDALIQTYTLPYIRILKKNLSKGSCVFLLTLEKNKEILAEKRKSEITSLLADEGIQWLPFAYHSFGLSGLLMWAHILTRLVVLVVRKNIFAVHCWCTPPGAIGYLLSLFLNRKLVLDSYEPHAEAMVENGTWKRQGFAFKLLFWLEKKQTQRADFVISATEGMREYAKQKYGVDIKNFFVKPACVDLNLFNTERLPNLELRKQLGLEHKLTCVYAGKFGGIYLSNEVFDFIREAIDYWGENFRFLILTNHSISEIAGYCSRAKVNIDQIIVRFVPHHEIASYMKLADFALTPVKPVPTKRYCTPIKNGEYWALGLPVVIPANISDDSCIIEKNGIGIVLHELNQMEYKNAIVKIDELRNRIGIHATIRGIAIRYRNFSIAEEVYRKVYSNIQ